MSHATINARALSGMYYQILSQGGLGWIDQLTFEVDSDQDSENHAWLGMPPTMREWIGGRHAKGFLDFDFSIDNKDYESTIRYHERDLREDKTGQLRQRIREHGRRALSHPASLLSTLILNGESAVCYDGQYFFDTDHNEGDSGNQSNDISHTVASATAPTAGEMEEAILQSIQTMYGFVDDQGEPLNETAMEFMVMVPIPFWRAARAAVANKLLIDAAASSARDNLIANSPDLKINVVANPRLSWTTKMVTFRTDGLPPFIMQVREPLTVDVNDDGDRYFDTREVEVGLKKAGNVGYGMWQGAVLTTLST